jgi:hypothetical protein
VRLFWLFWCFKCLPRQKTFTDYFSTIFCCFFLSNVVSGVLSDDAIANAVVDACVEPLLKAAGDTSLNAKKAAQRALFYAFAMHHGKRFDKASLLTANNGGGGGGGGGGVFTKNYTVLTSFALRMTSVKKGNVGMRGQDMAATQLQKLVFSEDRGAAAAAAAVASLDQYEQETNDAEDAGLDIIYD